MRVGGGFSSEVAGIKFGDGGVDVVEVEPHEPDDPLVGSYLDEAEQLDEISLGRLLPVRKGHACAHENEAFSPGCHHRRRHARQAQTGECPQVHELFVATVSDSRAHHPPAIVEGEVVAEGRRDGGPVVLPRGVPKSAHIRGLPCFLPVVPAG